MSPCLPRHTSPHTNAPLSVLHLRILLLRQSATYWHDADSDSNVSRDTADIGIDKLLSRGEMVIEVGIRGIVTLTATNVATYVERIALSRGLIES